MKNTILVLLFIAVMAMSAVAQTVTFNEGDMVLAPDGRTGKIETLCKGSDCFPRTSIDPSRSDVIAKVRYGPGPGETQFYMLTTLKIVKAPRSGPVETFHVGDLVMVPKDDCQSWGWCPSQTA